MQQVDLRVKSDLFGVPAGTKPSGPRECLTRRPATMEWHRHAVEKVLDVMRRDPTAPLDLQEMASIASMSRYHFLHVFEEVTGVSPLRFLAALRIERAKRLLLETSWSVTTICFEVGYNSLGTFTRLFVEYVGATPKSFRKLPRKLDERPLESLIASYFQRRRSLRWQRTISGCVQGPEDFRGVIFLGLFATRIPQRRPVDGTLMMEPGRFELAIPSFSQSYCVMAAGFPTGSEAMGYLLPSQSELLVASIPLPCKGLEDLARSNCVLALRPLEIFDPPILIALPILLSIGLTK
jgi:AraC family transcriptional regulator